MASAERSKILYRWVQMRGLYAQKSPATAEMIFAYSGRSSHANRIGGHVVLGLLYPIAHGLEPHQPQCQSFL